MNKQPGHWKLFFMQQIHKLLGFFFQSKLYAV